MSNSTHLSRNVCGNTSFFIHFFWCSGQIILRAAQVIHPEPLATHRQSSQPSLSYTYFLHESAQRHDCPLFFTLMSTHPCTSAQHWTASRASRASRVYCPLPARRDPWGSAKVHPKLGLPLNSLVLTTALVIIFGCIFLGSSSAFFAIISASVVALGVS